MPRLAACLIILACVFCLSLPATLADEHGDKAEPITPTKPIDLFNGKDLEGWVYDLGGQDTKPGDVFSVEDGVIKNTGRPSGVIRTQHNYKDYEIEVQWRWPGKGGNSGLLIHCSTPRNRSVWPKSLEVQLASKNAGDFWVIGETIKVKDPGKRTRGRRTTNYTDGSEKDLGEWNTMLVQARGNAVKVFINGDLVNEAWDCSADSGAICLQAEGTPIEYRKVQIRPLPEQE